MQEQPPSEPSRREPAERARRRSPKATFTPPAVPSQAAEPETPPAPEQPKPARRAKAAPTVLFRPPDPDPDQPLPRQPTPARPPAGPNVSSDTTADAGRATTDPEQVTADTSAEKATPMTASAPAKKPGAEKAPPAPATAPARKAARAKKAATAKKATPAKTAAPAETETPAERAAPVEEVPPARRATPVKKATTPRRATAPATAKASRPAKAAAVAPPTAAPPVAAGAEAVRAGAPRRDLRAVAARMLDHPGYAPELLALAAVDALGPGAGAWADRLRATYPQGSPDGLARLATRRFVRLAGAGGATAALAGVFAPVAELATVLWTQANLVLHLAAAYGRDPLHPDRAVDLLVLTQVHPDEASARTALAAARTADEPADGPWPRAAEAAWRLATPLAAQAGGWLALRLASRLLPGAAALAAAAGDAAAAERLAARVVTAYRPPRTG